tara:strand:- start:3814 stop:4182 length:369 start_codon:yes stop_codon:yes gene_type:complete
MAKNNRIMWSKDELNDLVTDIISELKEVGFSGVTDWDTFGDILKYKLKNSDEFDMLSSVVVSTYRDYTRFETDMALMNLSDKGLIRMYVDEKGKLAYGPTEEGAKLSTLIDKERNKNKNQNN